MLFEANGILYNYNCCYRSENHIDQVLEMIEDMAFKKLMLDKTGKTIPKEKHKLELQLRVLGTHRRRGVDVHSHLRHFTYFRMSLKYVLMRSSTSMPWE